MKPKHNAWFKGYAEELKSGWCRCGERIVFIAGVWWHLSRKAIS